MLYRWCRAVVSDLPLCDVLKAARHYSPKVAGLLQSRVAVKEFVEVMVALRDLDIFRVTDDAEYIHFHPVENTDEHVYGKIEACGKGTKACSVDLVTRLELLRRLDEVEPEEFGAGARAALNELALDPPAKKFFLKCLKTLE